MTETPSRKDRAVLIFNPRSGRGKPKQKLLPEVMAQFERHGMDVMPQSTEGPGHAIDMAREASRRGFALAIAWGGDGTLNEVAQGLLGTETPMAVLPGGTVNVFARETGIPLKLDRAIDTLASGRPARIPLGLAGERVFLLMAGIGIDGEVVYRLKAGFKDALGAYAFWLDGFKMLANYPMTPMRVRVNGLEYMGTGIVAGNLRRYGPSYFVARDAVLTEPKLDVVIFQGSRRSDWLRYLAGVIGRFHLRFRDVVHVKTDALDVETETPVRVQLDGEPAGHAPLEIRVQDDALTVILPKEYDVSAETR